jgi:hypothetical protein
MYTILLHISGLAMVEILFYFYYIGPVETTLFKKTMGKIVSQTLKELSSIIIINPNATNTYLDREESEFNNEMEKMNSQGEESRESRNRDLLIKAIYGWLVLACITLLITVLQLQCYNKQKPSINKIDSEQSLELVHMRLRSSSLDSAANEEKMQKKYLLDKEENKYLKIISLNVLYYTTFASFLLGFEYIFFQFVVLQYEPLSSDELKFIMYNTFYKMYNLND